MKIFEQFESRVRYYSKNYPVVFTKGYGCFLEDISGKKYIDFFSGAGALNYGHNESTIKKAIIKYLEEDGVCHSLDMATLAKKRFIDKFNKVILEPREMTYKLQFCGPTGTNAVEAAIKLARKVTNCQNIITFTNAFHGVSLGSLSLTGSKFKRRAAGVSLNNAIFMPYDSYLGKSIDTTQYIDKYLADPSSGIDSPAAFIVETIQAEGGVNTASIEWLKKMYAIAKKYNALFIVDDIQVGCGRTGTFFSFENLGFLPDLVCLSKSLSAYGLPLSLLLIKPEYDIWESGEHNGTFRGNNLAFISASEGLNFWLNKNFENSIKEKSLLLDKLLNNLINKITQHAFLKGRGMIRGIELHNCTLAKEITYFCFQNGLIIETAGARDQVIKLLPPLNISDKDLEEGINILSNCINKAVTL